MAFKLDEHQLQNNENDQGNVDRFPVEIVDQISSYLKLHELLKMRACCTFFKNSLQWQLIDRIKSKISFKKILSEEKIILMEDGTVWKLLAEIRDKDLPTTREHYSPSKILSDIKEMHGSNGSVFFIKQDNTILSYGANHDGQLGLGHKKYINTPTQLSGISDINQIAVGLCHTLFLKKDGTVWTCGDNSRGQLGLGDRSSKLTLRQIPLLFDICQIAAGHHHSVFLKKDGTVLVCGLGGKGQLGLARGEVLIPTQIEDFTDVCQIVVGECYTFFLKTDRTVYACGDNSYYQLGLKGKEFFSPTLVSQLHNIDKIFVNSRCTFFLDINSNVWNCGQNTGGKLARSIGHFVSEPVCIPEISKIKLILSDGNNTLFIDEANRFFVCGTMLERECSLYSTIGKFFDSIHQHYSDLTQASDSSMLIRL